MNVEGKKVRKKENKKVRKKDRRDRQTDRQTDRQSGVSQAYNKSFPDDDFLVKNVWISTFYQAFINIFNHILSILLTIMTNYFCLISPTTSFFKTWSAVEATNQDFKKTFV